MTADGMAGKYPVKNGGPDDIQTAWKILAGGAPIAAAALVDIAENGKSEIARVQASQAVLDRVGLATPKERPQVTFAVIPKEFDQIGIGVEMLDPAEVVRNRLKELSQGGPSVSTGASEPPPDWQVDGSGDDNGVVDAELMPMGDEDDGDWTGSNPWG